MRFLGADAPLGTARAAIQGLPYDGGVSFRAGARGGPEAIREMSGSLETFSPPAGRDLSEFHVHDAGDLGLAGYGAADVMERIEAATAALAETVGFVVSLGGDHSVSIGTARGLRRVHPELAHLVFDAHLDLRATFDGSELSHACGTWHMSAAAPTVVLGVRSGSRQEWEDAKVRLAGCSATLEMPEDARRALSGRPIHVSLDLDVLDPSVLPGTGNPEPGGVGFAALRDALLGLGDLSIVAVDMAELSPSIDPSGASAVAAAVLVRDLLCARL